MGGKKGKIPRTTPICPITLSKKRVRRSQSQGARRRANGVVAAASDDALFAGLRTLTALFLCVSISGTGSDSQRTGRRRQSCCVLLPQDSLDRTSRRGIGGESSAVNYFTSPRSS